MTQATRKLRVVHTTRYSYDRPVERSLHKLHLCPIYDWDQQVLTHTLTIAPGLATGPSPAADPIVETNDIEDVFGNWVTTFELTAPYTDLSITADSIVELYDVNPFAFAREDPAHLPRRLDALGADDARALPAPRRARRHRAARALRPCDVVRPEERPGY